MCSHCGASLFHCKNFGKKKRITSHEFILFALNILFFPFTEFSFHKIDKSLFIENIFKILIFLIEIRVCSRSMCGMGSDFLHSITFVFLTLSLTQRQDKSVKNNKLLAANKDGQLAKSVISNNC